MMLIFIRIYTFELCYGMHASLDFGYGFCLYWLYLFPYVLYADISSLIGHGDRWCAMRCFACTGCRGRSEMLRWHKMFLGLSL